MTGQRIPNEPDLYDEPPARELDRLLDLWSPEVVPLARTMLGDTSPSLDGLERVDLVDLFAGIDHEDAIVDGLVLRGRWAAIAAAAKAGKSTFLLYVSACLATGVHPITGHETDRVAVLYIDSEMGRVDLRDRLRDDLHLGPGDLDKLHYVDLVPMLNTAAGAGQVLDYVDRHDIGLVVIDGVNGVVIGPEKDDDTWRPLYSLTIAELKRRAVAVVSCDNLGKDRTLGPRGSSVKLDKADAVIELSRTDAGIRLKATHRRTAAYPSTLDLVAAGIDDDETALTYRETIGSWPGGTAEKARELDQVAAPLDVTNKRARDLLRRGGFTGGRNDVLAAAIRYRCTPDYQAGNGPGNALASTGGEQ